MLLQALSDEFFHERLERYRTNQRLRWKRNFGKFKLTENCIETRVELLFYHKIFSVYCENFFLQTTTSKAVNDEICDCGWWGKSTARLIWKAKKKLWIQNFSNFFFLFSAPAILFSSLFGSCYPMYLSSHILNLNFMAKNENSFSSCSRDLFSSGFFLNSSQLNNDHSFSYKISPDFPAELTKHWLQRKVHFHFVFFGG